MELAEIRPFEPQMAEIDLFTMPDAVGVGEPSVRKVKPYIAGHVTDGSSTFTFKVNGSDVTVSVSGGDWKYKPTTTITSLAFVGVPQLESLELNMITGVSTFNLDYPVVPMFKNCDATIEAALNYVYHIRGTATANFTFSLKYIDGNNTVTTVKENATIDANGKWDVSYSGKKIYAMQSAYKVIDGDSTWRYNPTSIEFTENLEELSTFNDGDIGNAYRGVFCNMSDLTSLKFARGTTFKKVLIARSPFSYTNLVELDIREATFENCTDLSGIINTVTKLVTARIDSINPKTLYTDNIAASDTKLENLYVPQNGKLDKSIVLSSSPLTYDSMLRVAGWLKDLTGDTAQTVTFKADTYNALTAEQKAALTAIIVTEKGWNLATA